MNLYKYIEVRKRLNELRQLTKPTFAEITEYVKLRPIGGGVATPAAIAAINTLLGLGDNASPPTFTTIANISDINGLQLASTIVDVTSHSTDVPWRQKIVTLLDAGDLSTTLFYVPGDTGHQELLAIFSGRELRSYTITFPEIAAPIWEFQAYISKFSLKEPVAGVITADTTFTATGEPNFDYLP